LRKGYKGTCKRFMKEKNSPQKTREIRKTNLASPLYNQTETAARGVLSKAEMWKEKIEKGFSLRRGSRLTIVESDLGGETAYCILVFETGCFE